MSVQWDDRYATGEAQVDAQHKTLFEQVGKLEGLLAKPVIDAKAVDALFKFLETFVRTHFVYEEGCMMRYHCPAHQANAAAHEAFLAFFGKAKQDYVAKGADRELLTRVHHSLGEWLVAHICKIDAQIKPCISAAPPRPRPAPAAR